jgi:probable rRNA maturation factor
MIHVTRKSPLPVDMPLSRIRRVSLATFGVTGKSGDASLVFTDDLEVKELNQEYRDIDAATDVLSFPSEETDPQTGNRYLGDVIISVERAKAQAEMANHPWAEELTMLIVHGCLHLSGFDHYTESEMHVMKDYQEAILKSLGIVNFSWPEEK